MDDRYVDEEEFNDCWDWMDNQPMIFYLIDIDESGEYGDALAMRTQCYKVYEEYWLEHKNEL